MKRIVLLLLCGILPLMVAAQGTRPVRGVVFDAQGTPMADATLTAVGSPGTATSAHDGTFEMMVSPYTKFISASKEGFVTTQAEVDGSYLVFKLVVDKKYLENKAKAEEAARLEAEAKAKAEAEARLAEERRIAAEKAAAEKAEQERLAAEERARIAEEKRIAAEKAAAEKAEAARLAAEEKARIAEEKRIAAEKAAAEKAEAARLAAEEKARIAEEKKRLEEEKRIAAEKAAAERAEAARLAAEEKARIAEQQRLANAKNGLEKQSEAAAAKRIEAEKALAEKQMKLDAQRAKAEVWRSAKLKGYRSIVEVTEDLSLNLDLLSNIHYIGGYQINNYFYVGVGVGVNIYSNDVDEQDYSFINGRNGLEILPLNLINFPVFGYFRANFIDNRWTPFFALSAGYRFGTRHEFFMPWEHTAHYNTGGVFINPQIGVNCRMTKKSDFFFAVGFNMSQIPFIDWDNTTILNAKFDSRFYQGFDFRVGVTF